MIRTICSRASLIPQGTRTSTRRASTCIHRQTERSSKVWAFQSGLHRPMQSQQQNVVLRSYYLGGDAHLYLEPTQEYVFDRPPQVGAMGDASSSRGMAGAASTQLHFESPGPNTASGSTGSGAGTAAAATTTTVGGAWAAYESTEFSPFEDILLDATAWMIAIVLCWDPMRGYDNLEEYEREREERKEREESRSHRRRQHRKLAATKHDDHNDHKHDHHHENDKSNESQN